MIEASAAPQQAKDRAAFENLGGAEAAERASAAASLLPAIRAARVDPAETLREE